MRAWLAAALACLLAACGGGGSSDWRIDTTPPPGTSEQTLSGRVAAGAPLIGVVEVSDASGAHKTAQIGAGGAYLFGLRGLTPPLLLRAIGQVGGRRTVLLSAATVEDLNGTVNITPFTDLIVANVAGRDAQAFHAAPDHGLLTASALEQARVMVTQRIAPVLLALQVDGGFDLRRTLFTTDHTGFDAVLDVLRVVVDPATQRATITDLVSGTQVVDKLAVPDDREALPSPVAGRHAAAAADLQAVEAALARLNALFANGLPEAGNADLAALLDPALMHHGLDRAAFVAADRLLSADSVGVRLMNPVLLSRAADGTRLRVAVQVVDTLGKLAAADQVDADEFEFRKDAAGQWRFAGDRRVADVELTAVTHLHQDDAGDHVVRAFEVWVPDVPEGVGFVRVSGPGLPGSVAVDGLGTVGGVVLQRADGGMRLLPNGPAGPAAWVLDCGSPGATLDTCIDWSTVPPGATYTVSFYDRAAQPIGEATDVMLPMPAASATDAMAMRQRWQPAWAGWSPVSFSALAAGVSAAVSWTGPADASYTLVQAGLAAGAQQWTSAPSAGATGAQLGPWQGAAPSAAPLAWLRVRGPGDREFMLSTAYGR